MLGLFGIGFNFLPQPFDMYCERLRLRKAVKAPDFIEQEVLAKCFSSIFNEQAQQVKFLLSEGQCRVSVGSRVPYTGLKAFTTGRFKRFE